MNASTPILSADSRRQLLALARGTLEARFRGEPPPRLPSDRSEAFGDPRALFVTLRIGARLRGCIGTLAPEGDLSRAVPKFALRAAFEDPEEIVIGRHGLILELGVRRGLLLPQVATEWGFDRETFLAEVSRKAGLPPDAWRLTGARIWLFQAEVFAEDEEAAQ